MMILSNAINDDFSPFPLENETEARIESLDQEMRISVSLSLSPWSLIAYCIINLIMKKKYCQSHRVDL